MNAETGERLEGGRTIDSRIHRSNQNAVSKHHIGSFIQRRLQHRKLFCAKRQVVGFTPRGHSCIPISRKR